MLRHGDRMHAGRLEDVGALEVGIARMGHLAVDGVECEVEELRRPVREGVVGARLQRLSALLLPYELRLGAVPCDVLFGEVDARRGGGNLQDMLRCVDEPALRQSEVGRHIAQREAVAADVELCDRCDRRNLHLVEFIVRHVDVLDELAVVQQDTCELVVRQVERTQVVGIRHIQLLQVVVADVEPTHGIEVVEADGVQLVVAQVDVGELALVEVGRRSAEVDEPEAVAGEVELLELVVVAHVDGGQAGVPERERAEFGQCGEVDVVDVLSVGLERRHVMVLRHVDDDVARSRAHVIDVGRRGMLGSHLERFRLAAAQVDLHRDRLVFRRAEDADGHLHRRTFRAEA